MTRERRMQGRVGEYNTGCEEEKQGESAGDEVQK